LGTRSSPFADISCVLIITGIANRTLGESHEIWGMFYVEALNDNVAVLLLE